MWGSVTCRLHIADVYAASVQLRTLCVVHSAMPSARAPNADGDCEHAKEPALARLCLQASGHGFPFRVLQATPTTNAH